MSNLGFITLHRKIKDSPIWTDSQAVHLWIHLLLKANHADNQFIQNGNLISVKRGQTVTGRRRLSDETGISESKIQRLLSLFESLQMIEQQTNSKNRLISIVNYDLYQSREQQMNNKRTASEQQVNTNNNDNNDNNVNNEYIAFEDFWNHWPKKTDKKNAEKAWSKLKVTDELYQKIVNHCSAAYLSTEKKFIPNPSTYLNQERWNDEIINQPSQPVQTKGYQNDNARQFNELFAPENGGDAIYENGRPVYPSLESDH